VNKTPLPPGSPCSGRVPAAVLVNRDSVRHSLGRVEGQDAGFPLSFASYTARGTIPKEVLHECVRNLPRTGMVDLRAPARVPWVVVPGEPNEKPRTRRGQPVNGKPRPARVGAFVVSTPSQRLGAIPAVPRPRSRFVPSRSRASATLRVSLGRQPDAAQTLALLR
jgi:hypothetical protein